MTKKKLHDEDSSFDERGLLRDGAVMRVRMTMRDGLPNPHLTGLQRAIATAKLDDGGDPLSLHRPGHRMLARDDDGELLRDGRKEALEDYNIALTSAWKSPIRDEVDAENGDFSASDSGSDRPSSPASSPRKSAVWSDAKRPGDRKRQAALADYDRELSQAWRKPR